MNPYLEQLQACADDFCDAHQIPRSKQSLASLKLIHLELCLQTEVGLHEAQRLWDEEVPEHPFNTSHLN